MDDIKKLQLCQLDILMEIDRVCKENGLEYCLAYGTCIGAIRHKGFIPWDDDIDIFMSAEDFKKFNTLSASFREPYFLQTRHTDPEYALLITRVRNSNTTLIEETENFRDINHGVFVDVYPLYDSPENKFHSKMKVWSAMVYKLLLYGVAPKNRGKLMKVGGKIMLALTPKFIRKPIINKLYKVFSKPCKTDYVTTYYAGSTTKRFPKKWYFPAVWVPFEDITLPVPGDYEAFLTATYGDYMQLPPEDQQAVHHPFEFIDVDTPYINYKGKYYCKDKE